ncbi:uncharacterized protein ycf20 isoform X1 [Solanum lycopersicum]|uniref:Ycf20-like protein n=1 Tax=Solanum lycopersicum TaxID=4081 RepID=A0A3Q7IN48_SOLLC|nr:ycf20-like protein isoform X1 [Solanum lycopersicum]XP_019071727.1 ycf20-like protein isoform X1 [Solanum lycopersicum]XP_019071728.1 ycf20-like protein isoform X1 [Solanum lycopersicum]
MELSAFGELHIHWAESCISGYLLLILSNLILSEFSSEFFPLSCETLMYLDGCASSPLQQMDNMHNKEPCMISAGFPRRRAWSIRSAADGSGLDSSPTTSGSSGTRLIRAIEALLVKLDARIKVLRKNLPMKLLFFLVGFYCATAFATVIGQTGDWDIISSGLAVAVVEGIGALMYRSIPLIDGVRSIITMFNYWKTGLTLGLFLDSFKY